MTTAAALPMLRQSERRDFRRCPQRWWWGWREGLRLRYPRADALWFGAGMHLAWAHWYCGPGAQRGDDPLGVWNAYVGETCGIVRIVNPIGEEEFVEAGELGAIMIEEYLNLYGNDEHMDVIVPEGSFRVDVPDPRDSSQMLVVMCGTFDVVWRHAVTGKIWLEEHKHVKQIDTKHLSLDDQAGTYWSMSTPWLRHKGYLGPREIIAGIEYNFLRKAKPDDRPRNPQGHYTNLPKKEHYFTQLKAAGVAVPVAAKLDDMARLAEQRGVTVYGDVSKQQGSPRFVREPVTRHQKERLTQVRRIQAEAIHMGAMREGILPLYKNSTQDCSWDCPFFDMCELHEAGGDYEEYREALYVVRDPYADHRDAVD